MKVRSEIQSVVKRISTQEKEVRRSILSQLPSKDDYDELVMRHSMSQRHAAKVAGMTPAAFRDKVQEAVDAGVISAPSLSKNRYQFSLSHMFGLLDYMKVPSWKDEFGSCFVSCISNLKGGTGKSTSTISIATGFALQIRKRPKTLIIDLDPQGSILDIVAPPDEVDSEFISAVDIMLGDDEPDGLYSQYRKAGYSHDQIVESACHPTHIENLDIMPAFPSDERFSFQATVASWDKTKKSTDLDYINWFKTKVINHLRTIYDVIFIDTGPNRSPLLWTALEASDGLIVPVTPHKIDYISTINFLEGLESIFDVLPSSGENLKWWQLLAVNYDEEYKRDDKVLDDLKDGVGRYMCNSVIKRSSAFEAAARHYRTIYDIRKSDGLCPPRQLDRALDSINAVVREIILKMKDVNEESRNG
jgi:chromosome partitioning protein